MLVDGFKVKNWDEERNLNSSNNKRDIISDKLDCVN